MGTFLTSAFCLLPSFLLTILLISRSERSTGRVLPQMETLPMPKPKDTPDRKRQANKQNAQKAIGPHTPPESEPRPSESGRGRDDPSVYGPIRATIQAARKFRQKNPDSNENKLNSQQNGPNITVPKIPVQTERP